MIEEENDLAPSSYGSAEMMGELRALIAELQGRVADIESGLTGAGIPFPAP